MRFSLLILTAFLFPAAASSRAQSMPDSGAGSRGSIVDVNLSSDADSLEDLDIPPRNSRPVDSPLPGIGSGFGSAYVGAESPSLETEVKGNRVILDWAGGGREPARFLIHSSDGRYIATRRGRRSVQGWMASLRVAGWPSGIYSITAESAGYQATGSFLIR